MKTNVDALIFDMDGVIVDSEPLHLAAWQAVLQDYGVSYTPHDHQNFLGRKDIFMAGEICTRFSLKLPKENLVHLKESTYLNLIRERAVARPGVNTILDAARDRGLPCAVASSATIPTIQLTLSVLNLTHRFCCLTSGDEVEHGKPAPDIFLLAANRLTVSPSQCVVIEDTLNGIRAAKSAGMYCVGIPCEATAHQDHSEADLRLQSLHDLVRLLQLPTRVVH